MNDFLVEFGAPFSSDGGVLSNIQLGSVHCLRHLSVAVEKKKAILNK